MIEYKADDVREAAKAAYRAKLGNSTESTVIESEADNFVGCCLEYDGGTSNETISDWAIEEIIWAEHFSSAQARAFYSTIERSSRASS